MPPDLSSGFHGAACAERGWAWADTAPKGIRRITVMKHLKWTALLAGVMILYRLLMGSYDTKILILCSLFPYILFFGPFWIRELKARRRIAVNRKRFDKDMWR